MTSSRFLNLDSMLTQGKLTRDDMFSALADTTPKEREACRKIWVDHDTGVFQADLDELAKR